MKSMVCIAIVPAALIMACTGNSPQTEIPRDSEVPTLSLTLWSSRTELFMEYPPLVQDERTAFAVHLTDLSTFRPISEGKVILEMEKDGNVSRFESKGPSRPGIFRLHVQATGSDRYRSRMRIIARGFEDVHDLGEMVVYAEKARALREVRLITEQEQAIRFSKEQQWSSDFATEVVAPRNIPEGLRVPATVKPRGNGEGSAITPVTGRLLPWPKPPLPGQRVQKGEVVAAVVPFTATPQDLAGLKLELSQAETKLDLTRRQRIRLESLLAEGAVPARRVEEIKSEEAIAQARLDAARERLYQFEWTRSDAAAAQESIASAFLVKAPLAGMVTKVSGVIGGAVEAGQEILHIIAVDHVWVVAEVPESNSRDLLRLRSAELEVPGSSKLLPLYGSRGKIGHIERLVDPQSRRIAVILDVANHDGLLRIGQALFVRLGLGEPLERIAVPLSALVDDGGRPIIFLQIAGESFRRRAVRTGTVGQGYVQILEGVHPGERVVSRGAYTVRLAALSTQIPAHGHVH